MKKHLLVLLSLFITVTTVQAERISQEDAALVANHFMNAASASGAKKAVQPMRLKKAASVTENQYYVYENANGEGWVMVAADDAVTPILAYSKTGQFSTDNMPVNVRSWLGKYDKFIQKISDEGIVASEETQAQWSKLRKGVPDDPAGTVIVSPLIQTQWNQNEPYNLYAPGSGIAGEGSDKAYTGCVATAMAQVMKYWEWPIQGNGSHTYQPVMDIWDNEGNYAGQIIVYENTPLTAEFGKTTYDWANMKKKHYTSDTQAQKQAVGTLMFHCGVSVEMQYGGYEYDGSGAITINYQEEEDFPCAQNALWQYFRYKKDGLISYKRDGYQEGNTIYYSSWKDADWTAMIKAELDKKHPIMYDGSGTGGHSFICDGYDSKNYFHFNWGWAGQNDGWYLLSKLNPGSGGAGGGNYDFSEAQCVIIGIVPDKPDLPNRNVTWMANGQIFDETVATAGVLSLPSSQPANCESGKVFVGWTASENYESETTAPTYVEAGTIIEADATYYAVYANSEDGSVSVEKTVKFADLGYANQTDVTTVNMDNCTLVFSKGEGSNAPKYYDLGTAVRCYKNNTLTISSENEITKVVFATVNSYAGTISASVGSYEAGTWTGNSKEITFTHAPSDNSQWRITDITVTTGGGASYSNYSTACGAAVVCELTGISLNTDNVQKEFNVGDQFTSEGLVVTANFSNCESKTVTAVVNAPDMMTAGEKTIVVTYENETASYKINVKEIVTYTITYISCGSEFTTQVYHEGETLNLPAPAPGANAGKAFYGWIAAEQYTGSTAPTIIKAGSEVKANATYYAVFK